MKYKVKDSSREPITDSKCRHYWMIESAKGSTSRGVCKFCGAEREFHNSWPGVTVVRQNTQVPEFPDSSDIELDSEGDESELEESNASL